MTRTARAPRRCAREAVRHGASFAECFAAAIAAAAAVKPPSARACTAFGLPPDEAPAPPPTPCSPRRCIP